MAKKTLIRNFVVTDDWRCIPIYGIAVKYFAHRDGTIISLPNQAYIERLESYGRRVIYTTATIIQNTPAKRQEHGDRVTFCIGQSNGKRIYNSFLRQNAVWAAWHNFYDLTNDNSKKFQHLTFKDGNPHNCAIDNLEERKDYCRVTDEFTKAYCREWKWILAKLHHDYEDYNIQIDTLRDIVSETFVLSIARLQDEKNNSHRIGIFWYKSATRLLHDVIKRKCPVDYYTRRLRLALPPPSSNTAYCHNRMTENITIQQNH